MLAVYDVELELLDDATSGKLARLKDHLKTLKIVAIGIDPGDYKPKENKISFTIYGDFCLLMMKRVVRECTNNIFPGSVVELSKKTY